MKPNDEIINNKIIPFSTIKETLKSKSEYRIGSLAVYETMNALNSFFDHILEKAEESIRKENEIRKKKGLIPRKTIQNNDIKYAIESISINE